MNVTFYRENAVNIYTIPINPQVTIEYHAAFLDPSICWFYSESEYLECNGTWSKFSARKMFSISADLMITVNQINLLLTKVIVARIITYYKCCFIECLLFEGSIKKRKQFPILVPAGMG